MIMSIEVNNDLLIAIIGVLSALMVAMIPLWEFGINSKKQKLML